MIKLEKHPKMAGCLEKLGPFLGKGSVGVSRGKPSRGRGDAQVLESRGARAAAAEI